MDRLGKAGLRAGTPPAAGEGGWLLRSSFGGRFAGGKEVGTASLGSCRAPLTGETQKAERCSVCPLPL